ncbi:MAG: LacI family DNA-binding transcriptional regulator [Halanaerobiaceae bacterium]
MPLTLKNIAEMVGVAESTVSRALNGKSGVGEETRKKIMAIAEKYNYSPNKMARGLAKQETKMLALFLPDLSTPAYVSIIESIEDVANARGYQIILCNTKNSPEKEKAYLELVERNQVDGAIIAGGKLADEHIVKAALNERNNLVLVNRLVEEVFIPTVLIDKAYGAYLATEYLIRQGENKCPAIIMGSEDEYVESQKLAGYKRALAAYNISFSDDYVVGTDGSRKQGYEAFLQLVERKEVPRSFFVTRDVLAVGLIEAVKMGGYFIPADFRIVGYGKTLLTSMIDPQLTAVAEPLQETGEIAAKYLIDLIGGKSPEQGIRVLNPVLEDGDSA